MAETYISDEMRAIVGREYGEQVSFPVAASDIRRWAVATYYPEKPPPLFWDEAYAASTPFGGIVAPEEFNPFAWMPAFRAAVTIDESITYVSRTEEMFEGQLGIPGPGLANQLNGGAEISYPGPRMRPGDVIRSVTRISAYTEKPGRLGLMLFTTGETEWTNQRSETVRISHNILIRY